MPARQQEEGALEEEGVRELRREAYDEVRWGAIPCQRQH